MGSRITFNGKNLDFPVDIYLFQVDYPRMRIPNMSPTKVAETLNVGPDVLINLAFRWLVNATASHATLKRNLYQWFEWASQGLPWTFARDSSKTALTTLSAGALAGDSTITVSSITGLSSGDQCILKSATQQELVKINGAPSGSTVTLTETLNFDFVSGSRFRHEQYWPALLLDSTKHANQERAPLHFDVELLFTEDMN